MTYTVYINLFFYLLIFNKTMFVKDPGGNRLKAAKEWFKIEKVKFMVYYIKIYIFFITDCTVVSLL